MKKESTPVQQEEKSIKDFFWKHKKPVMDSRLYTVEDAAIKRRFHFYEDEEIEVRIKDGKR